MLLVKRLGELRRLERQLQSLRRSNVHASVAGVGNRDPQIAFNVQQNGGGKKRTVNEFGEEQQQQRKGARYHGEREAEDASAISDALEDTQMRELLAQRHTAQTNKIMFRQLPIVFSLIERTLAQQIRASRRRAQECRDQGKDRRGVVYRNDPLQLGGPNTSTSLSQITSAMDGSSEVATGNVVGSGPTTPRRSRRLMSVKDAKMLLKGLHTAEEARKQHYDTLYSNATRGLQRNANMRGHVAKQLKQCKKRSVALQNSEFAVKLGAKRNSSKHASDANQMDDVEERKARLESKLQHLDAERVELLDDISVLQQSVLARPYLSANMWRKVLDGGMWLSLIRDLEKEKHEHSLTSAGVQRPSNSTSSRDALALMLVLTRLVLGVLRHVVVPSPQPNSQPARGAHSQLSANRETRDHINAINKRSPRFVVSMPSRKKRRQKRDGAAAQTSNGQSSPLPPGSRSQDLASTQDVGARIATDDEDTGSQDLLALMLSGAGDLLDEAHSAAQHPSGVGTPTPTTHVAVHKKPNSVATIGEGQLRWMPQGETDVLPLVQDTLGVITTVLEHISCPLLVNQGYACELFELFSTIQTLTTSFLYLATPSSSASADGDSMHTMLQRLECTLENGAREACLGLQECVSPSPVIAVAEQTSSPYENLSYEKAGRLVLSMNSMQLFSSSPASTADDARRNTSPAWSPTTVLSYFTMQMFPFLATNTLQTLVSRARQTSLYAFTTRGYRAKTRRGHDAHTYSSKDALTAVQEVRLQRRRMAATLREGKLAELQNSYVQAVARTFSLQSLCRLFNVYVRVWMTSQSRSQWNQPAMPEVSRSANEYRIFMGSIFIADALVQRALTRPGEAEDLSLMDMSTLLMSACTMWPEVSRQLDVQQQHAAGRTSPRKHSSSESETLGRFIGFILESENEVLASRVQQLQPALTRNTNSAYDTSDDASHSSQPSTAMISLQSLRFMVFASNQLASLSSISEVGRTAPGGVSRETLHLLQVQGSLLRTLLNSDSQLWQAARGHRSENRALIDQLCSEVAELWHKLGIADSSATAALQKLESIRSRLN